MRLNTIILLCAAMLGIAYAAAIAVPEEVYDAGDADYVEFEGLGFNETDSLERRWRPDSVRSKITLCNSYKGRGRCTIRKVMHNLCFGIPNRTVMFKKASSMVIQKAECEFYEMQGCKSNFIALKPGSYPDLRKIPNYNPDPENKNKSWDNKIAAYKCTTKKLSN